MRVSRDWATPLTFASFAVIAVTGVLMFFHLDSGLNKVVHEWLGWVVVAGVVLHVMANAAGFKRHVSQARARWVVAAGAAVLALSFVPAGSGDPPFAPPLRALAAAPIPVLAQVAGISAAQMEDRLRAAGVTGSGDSLQARVGPDLRQQVGVLRQVLAPASAG